MTKKDTVDGAPPEAAAVEEKIDELNAEAEKIDEKIDDPDTSAAERAKLEERLGKIEDQMNGLGDKLDQLISSPVAPSPRRTEETAPAAPAAPAAEETPAAEEEPPKKHVWWGNRTFD